MSKTKLLLDVVENLRNLADSLQDLHDVMVKPLNVETVGAIEEKNKNSEKTKVSLEEVRGLLAKKSKEGKSAEVRALIQGYGVVKLSEINTSDYEDLFKKAEVL
ncbi:rRNA biogenesis protein rrp5 [Gemella sp. zg-570]|uniref:rRNA biogenesis protein rrp5 n=1 Tax=Gemella sp. zg-570 TaxID=2840371 RepID=UPI001C0411F8|nr:MULTISPECIES: rRNA biogenesis protein rrp5 [unclassified Gemella]MBU0278735.1 rRNA biogenesis protein rrp5 [Gemella sp. zg-1178]QWQ38676.1 rRNA biogenesis protein rrp5 [Gemella sp. zg-570]